jgi:hypothetical protein
MIIYRAAGVWSKEQGESISWERAMIGQAELSGGVMESPRERACSFLNFLKAKHIPVFSYTAREEVKIIMQGVSEAEAKHLVQQWRVFEGW